jgi:beta-1,4-mannosyl-glycoprotein beta-1,4-N-acetylglucosaminyltransferase
MIYDAFLFFNEFELLELRLHELADIVDRFILVESPRTFTFHSKPLHFHLNRNRFTSFLDRIIHVVVDDFSGVATTDPWQVEYAHRQAIWCAIKRCRMDDVILLSDVDEIPRATAIRSNLSELGIQLFEQTWYYYYFNCESWGNDARTRMGRYADLLALDGNLQAFRQSAGRLIPNGGWHFSHLGGIGRIREKLDAFSHQEVNRPQFRAEQHMKRCLETGTDLYGRTPEGSFRYVPIDETFPRYLLENLPQFAAHIWKPAWGETSKVKAGPVVRSLREIGLACGTDKVCKHHYDRWYEQQFKSLRNRPLRLLEIGVDNGASLRMWEEYFPQAEIIGIDVDPRCKQFQSSRATIHIGDQCDRDFLRQVISSTGGNFDVIIDDGGHRMNQQRFVLRTLFSALRPGGWFVMEDVETSYYPDYGGGPVGQAGTTMDVLKQLVDGLNVAYHGQSADDFDASIGSEGWTCLVTKSSNTASGAALRVLPDRSLLVCPPYPQTDTLVVKSVPSLSTITGIRMEVISDAALPHGANGCSRDGAFVLTGLRARWSGPDGAGPIGFRCAIASSDRPGFETSRVLTHRADEGWSSFSRPNRIDELIVHFNEPLRTERLKLLIVVVECLFGQQHILGRFRLSATDRTPPPSAATPPTVQAIHFYPNICFLQRNTSDTVMAEVTNV